MYYNYIIVSLYKENLSVCSVLSSRYLNHHPVLVLSNQHKVAFQKQIIHQQLVNVIRNFLSFRFRIHNLSFLVCLSLLSAFNAIAQKLPRSIEPELFCRLFAVASCAFDCLHLPNINNTISLNCLYPSIQNKSQCI